MPEILRDVDDVTVRLPAPEPVLDPTTARAVEVAVAAAEARARAEGEAAGRASAVDTAQRAADAVGTALREVREELAAQRSAACGASIELAERLAAAVLGRTPPDDACTVHDRVREAVATLDDMPLTVRLHPHDHATLAGGVMEPGLDLVADPGVAPGDARVTGANSAAELTRAALLRAAVETLEESS